jgi:zinc transport system ATP-binding protein
MAVGVELQNITVVSEGNTLIENVSAFVPAGSLTFILGPNGGGKTTLLKCILNIIKYSGKVIFHGAKDNKIKIGYVPQKINVDRDMPLTVLEYLVSGFQKLPIFLGILPKFKKEALDVLKLTGAEGLIDKRLGRLSGGEMQRVLVALALMQKPDVLILDEPSGGIDISGETLFCGLISSIKKQLNITVIMVTHDIEVVRAHADNVILLKKTLRGSGTISDTLTDAKLKELFGIHDKEKKDCHFIGGEEHA